MKFSACFYIKRNRNEIKIFNTAYLRKDDFFGPMRFVCFVQLLGQCIRCVDAEFMIRSIELAFRAWEKLWASEVSFGV